MRIGGRKLWELMPPALQPLVRRAGREWLRMRQTMVTAELRMRMALNGAVALVSGAETIEPSRNDLVVVGMVRNASAHLPTFLAHYERLGARHIVLLDNGSTDETLGLIVGRPHVTVLRTALPFARYEMVLKRWLVERFHADGWVLVADADELFDYPWSARLPLRGFLGYLDHFGYDAVCAQNLEMVPDAPLRSYQGRQVGDLRCTHRWYDTTDYRRTDEYWRMRNTLGSPELWSHTGGIWETFFDYRGSKLTKQPLMRRSRGMAVFPYDVHFVTGARIADVSGVFRHYKYTGRFVAHVAEELERKQHYNGAEIFRHYERVLSQGKDVSFVRPTSREWTGAEALLDDGFLVASAAFRRWVAAYGVERGVRERSA